MFNLIPDSVKEKILKDYLERRVVVWLFALFLVSLMTIIFLLPAYVHVFFEEKNIRADVEVVKNSLQLKKADDVVGTIKATNELLKALSPVKSQARTSEILEKALGAKNAAIHITDIEYMEAKTSSSTMLLKGIADKRESLREFVTKLESTEGFAKVELPVSNFAKDKNIDFSINITLL